jgi:hypothetical protein
MPPQGRPDVDELAARMLAGMWRDGWVSVRTIDRSQVIDAYAGDVPEYVATKALQRLIEDGVVRDDHESVHGWPPDRISAVNSPEPIREYIDAIDESLLPYDLR